MEDECHANNGDSGGDANASVIMTMQMRCEDVGFVPLIRPSSRSLFKYTNQLSVAVMIVITNMLWRSFLSRTRRLDLCAGRL